MPIIPIIIPIHNVCILYSFVFLSSLISITSASGSISLTSLFKLFKLNSLSLSYDMVDCEKLTITLFSFLFSSFSGLDFSLLSSDFLDF